MKKDGRRLPDRSTAKLGRRRGKALIAAIFFAWAGVPAVAFADPGASVESERPDHDRAPDGNWRTRAVLDAQRRAGGAPAPTSGVEAGVIHDNHLRSIGKGGAGAEISPRRGAGSTFDSR